MKSYLADPDVTLDEPEAFRALRSVWTIPTQGFPGAHFATWPIALAERIILAGCPKEVCQECGRARERVVEQEQPPEPEHRQPDKRLEPGQAGNVRASNMGFRASRLSGQEMNRWKAENPGTVTFTDCGHDAYAPGVVLDPFAGACTTLLVARRLGRHSIGIDLKAEYLDMGIKRLAAWWKDPPRPREPAPDQLLLVEPA